MPTSARQRSFPLPVLAAIACSVLALVVGWFVPLLGVAIGAAIASSLRDVTYVKRVVAGPGDTVAFRHGLLIRNGKPVREPYAGSLRRGRPLRAATADHRAGRDVVPARRQPRRLRRQPHPGGRCRRKRSSAPSSTATGRWATPGGSERSARRASSRRSARRPSCSPGARAAGRGRIRPRRPRRSRAPRRPWRSACAGR
jgi:Signal peptidase, peptidase S26